MQGTKPKIGPYSRLLARGCVDGRSREGRYLADIRARLAAHVGGRPSFTQAELIKRAAWLSLHVMLMDERILTRDGMTPHDANQYLAWSNSLSRCLRDLGIEGAKQKPPTLNELLAGSKAA